MTAADRLRAVRDRLRAEFERNRTTLGTEWTAYAQGMKYGISRSYLYELMRDEPRYDLSRNPRKFAEIERRLGL